MKKNTCARSEKESLEPTSYDCNNMEVMVMITARISAGEKSRGEETWNVEVLGVEEVPSLTLGSSSFFPTHGH